MGACLRVVEGGRGTLPNSTAGSLALHGLDLNFLKDGGAMADGAGLSSLHVTQTTNSQEERPSSEHLQSAVPEIAVGFRVGTCRLKSMQRSKPQVSTPDTSAPKCLPRHFFFFFFF